MGLGFKVPCEVCGVKLDPTYFEWEEREREGRGEGFRCKKCQNLGRCFDCTEWFDRGEWLEHDVYCLKCRTKPENRNTI